MPALLCILLMKPRRKTVCATAVYRVFAEGAARLDYQRFGKYAAVESAAAGILWGLGSSRTLGYLTLTPVLGD